MAVRGVDVVDWAGWSRADVVESVRSEPANRVAVAGWALLASGVISGLTAAVVVAAGTTATGRSPAAAAAASAVALAVAVVLGLRRLRRPGAAVRVEAVVLRGVDRVCRVVKRLRPRDATAAALVAAGTDAPHAVAAVLLHRLVAPWSVLAAGRIVFARVRRTQRATPERAESTGAGRTRSEAL